MARIMIVDDEGDLLDLYTEMLTLFGHDIISAVRNGEEAIRSYKELDQSPDVILLDHRMPIINGLETAMEILNMNPDEKILFISADMTVKEKALDIGAIGFLEKPFLLNKLKETIDMILKE